jgi:hypothetical protein
MDDTSIRSVPAIRYRLQLDESIYCDLLAQLKGSEAEARKLPGPQGKKVADGIAKAIGLLCLTEFRKECREIRRPVPTDHPSIMFPLVRVTGNRLTVTLADDDPDVPA